MKNIIFILCLFIATAVQAQKVNGKLLINKASQIELKLKDGNAVELFKQFKTGDYQVQFSFDASGAPVDEQKRQIVLFTFETAIYQNGKLLGAVKRKPMPFFPGEMLEPVEAFDIIALLSEVQGDPQKAPYPGKLKNGTYKIVIKAIPNNANGYISSAAVVIFI